MTGLVHLQEEKEAGPSLSDQATSKEELMKSIPYFDNDYILKGSRARIFAEIGLIDMTCPPTSVLAALNQAKGRKTVYTVPYRPHHQPEGALAKTWEKTIYEPRELFIQNFLK